MALSCGIVGLPLVGKTTFFNLLTHQHSETSDFFSGKTATNSALADIPDSRIDFLTSMFKPRKITPAQVEVIDVPGLVRGASQGQGAGNDFLNAVKDVDAIIHVVRSFENPNLLHVDGSIDIMRDVETVNLELLFADLNLVETRLTRIATARKKTPEVEQEGVILSKIKAVLEDEKMVQQADLSADEKLAISHITFLTDKPQIMVINLDEKQLESKDYPQREKLLAYCGQKNIPILEISAKSEVEIDELEDEDKVLFMEELGIETPGTVLLARAMYECLNLVSFLTAGEDEVRAWTINKGTEAKKAGGKIHSDIERGFIRAEVVKFQDLKDLGSMAKVKEKGLFKLEGKEYIVMDRDIINFRFNV